VAFTISVCERDTRLSAGCASAANGRTTHPQRPADRERRAGYLDVLEESPTAQNSERA